MPDKPPIRQELEIKIVNDLADGHDRNDIIQMVCEQASIQWPEAEALVRNVETEKAHAITGRQSLVIVALAAAIIASGMGLVYYGAYSVLAALHGSLLMQLLNLADSIYPIAAGVVGLCMIAGGIIGLYQHWLRYFAT